MSFQEELYKSERSYKKCCSCLPFIILYSVFFTSSKEVKSHFLTTCKMCSKFQASDKFREIHYLLQFNSASFFVPLYIMFFYTTVLLSLTLSLLDLILLFIFTNNCKTKDKGFQQLSLSHPLIDPKFS